MAIEVQGAVQPDRSEVLRAARDDLLEGSKRLRELGEAYRAQLQAAVGPDAPTVVNERGAKQAASPYRFDLIPPEALFALAEVLAQGAAKYGEWNWRGLTINDQLNHLLVHVYAYLAGDPSDDHLAHALCRAVFALSLQRRPEVEG